MNRFHQRFCTAFSVGIVLATTLTARAQAVVRYDLDSKNFDHWTGITQADNGAGVIQGSAVYHVSDGPKGLHNVGLMQEDDGTIDMRGWYALKFDIQLDRDDAPYVLNIKLSIPPQKDRKNWNETSAARVQIQGRGWQAVTVPIDSFDYNRGQVYFLKFVKEIALKGGYVGRADPGKAMIRSVRVVRADTVYIESPILSKPADAGASVTYPLTITNTSESPQAFSLGLQRTGWEGFRAQLTPAMITLKQGESATAMLQVTVPDSPSIPPGAEEKQTVLVTPLGGDQRSASLEFTTLRRVPSPYLMFDEAGWQEVRDKVAKYDWAKNELAEMTRRADAWQVDEVLRGVNSDRQVPALFRPYGAEGNVANTARAYKITGNKAYAEKAALFLRRMSDPETGYPKTLQATTGDIPQEGGFFGNSAYAYDAIRDSGVLSDADKRQIEASFRIYANIIIDMMGDGGISNWSVFNLAPAVKCCLVIQDMERVDKLLNGPCGLVDHLRYGMMDDGWWYEMSLSYNIGCATEYTSAGLALKAFGNDFLNQRFPVATTNNVGLRPFEYDAFEGMAFGKFGPVKDNYVTIKKFWDGILPYPDYRGVMFGMGDGHEQAVGGGPFELAYYAFRDPAYAAIIKSGHRRDLLYGVAELPGETAEPFKLTAKSDNAGIAVLRSQTADRPIREQIQVAMKYGTHGGYHGHFDNVSLASLMRYGRSFFNPETSWFGYTNYMYKWWVQTSMASNMVVVDGKMQEPKECRTLLFHSGPMLNVIAAETDARWSNPPYFGGYAQIEKVKSGDAPYVPVPDSHPNVSDVTDFTEPVRQRRLILVTDDYVLLADDLKSDKPHTFDDLMHLRGATLPSLEGAVHQAQFDINPLSSGQFITNVNRLAVTAPYRIESVHLIGGTTRLADSFPGEQNQNNWESGGAKSLSEPGELHIDEHILWPAKVEVAIGDYAESWTVSKKLAYDVQGDGKKLASGLFGAWILGSGSIDVDVTGIKTLRLAVNTNRARNTKKTIFWTNAELMTADGKETPLADLAARTREENVSQPPKPGLDYEGGPIRVAGELLSAATALPGEPDDISEPGVITVDLSGLNAVRFKAGIGGDWPVGDEGQLRKTVAIRAQGTSASFLTLLEPFETKRMVKSATAMDAGHVHVELNDGRVQEITISKLDSDDGVVAVDLRETVNGKPVRQESASGSDR